MKFLLFPLRLTIPAILLLMGCLAGGFSYQRQVSLTHDRIKEELTQYSKLTASTTAQLIEYLYRRTEIQNSQSEGVTLLISRLSGDANLNVALFCDEKNLIRNASLFEFQNSRLQDTPWADLIPVLNQVRRDRTAQIILSKDQRQISAIYPVTFPPQPGDLRSNRVGTVVLNYDLTKAEKPAIVDAINQSLQVVVILVLLCVLVGVLLDRIVTQRARRLVTASHQLAQGHFQVRVQVYGADELAQIAQAFNEMAAQIQQNTEALQTSEKQLKAQTEELETTLHELNQTQLQLVQQEKMSSLGQLVAGVAHEINNPVSFIHGNLVHIQTYSKDLLQLIDLYQKSYPHPTPEIQAEIEEIDLEFLQDDLLKVLSSMKIGTDRIRQIVLSLRNFSRMDESDFKDVDLHEGIESTLLILQHRLKATPQRPEIALIRDYGKLPPVECHGGRLNQVLMNILANAIDALEDLHQRQAPTLDRPPSYHIKVRTAVIDADWVEIAIADNGPGIPEDLQAKIFDPFFTTKPVGKGTGLGMSISYQIITEKHGGKLECFSKPGEGTTFIIQIPIRQNVEVAV